MNRSIVRPPSAQPHVFRPRLPLYYIATNGQDLLEADLSLTGIVSSVQAQCLETGEDAALWMVRDDAAPWLLASIRRGPGNTVLVQWL